MIDNPLNYFFSQDMNNAVIGQLDQIPIFVPVSTSYIASVAQVNSYVCLLYSKWLYQWMATTTLLRVCKTEQLNLNY